MGPLQMLEGWGMDPEEEEAAAVLEGVDDSAGAAPASTQGLENGDGGSSQLLEPLLPVGCCQAGRSASIDGSEGPPGLEEDLLPEEGPASTATADGAVEEGEEAAEELLLPRQQKTEPDEAQPALVDMGSDGSDASAPSLVADSMCSADSGTAPPSLTASQLSCDEPPPLMADSMYSTSSTAGEAAALVEPAVPEEAVPISITATRTGSRAEQAAAAYQAAETARLAVALLSTGDGEEGCTVEVPLQEGLGSLEAESQAVHGSAAEGSSSGDDDWTVVSASCGADEQGQTTDEEAQASAQPADLAAA
ncbi:hypothetical protein ABPG77_003376 [Micractinium sp. CCAP 211/92]